MVKTRAKAWEKRSFYGKILTVTLSFDYTINMLFIKISIWFPEKKDDRYDGDDSTSEDEDDDEDEEDENEDAEEDPEKKQAKLDEKLKRKNEFFAKRNWRSQRHEREEFHKSKKVNYWEILKCLPLKSRIPYHIPYSIS